MPKRKFEGVAIGDRINQNSFAFPIQSLAAQKSFRENL